MKQKGINLLRKRLPRNTDFTRRRIVSILNMFLPFNRFTTTKKGVYSLIDCQKTARNTWLKCGPQWGALGWKTSLHVAVTHDLMTVGESDMSSVGTDREWLPKTAVAQRAAPPGANSYVATFFLEINGFHSLDSSTSIIYDSGCDHFRAILQATNVVFCVFWVKHVVISSLDCAPQRPTHAMCVFSSWMSTWRGLRSFRRALIFIL